MGLVPDNSNKVNIVIKQVTQTFGFQVHTKLKVTQYCSLLSMQQDYV